MHALMAGCRERRESREGGGLAELGELGGELLELGLPGGSEG